MRGPRRRVSCSSVRACASVHECAARSRRAAAQLANVLYMTVRMPFEAVWERQARGGPDERILSVDGGDDMFHF